MGRRGAGGLGREGGIDHRYEEGAGEQQSAPGEGLAGAGQRTGGGGRVALHPQRLTIGARRGEDAEEELPQGEAVDLNARRENHQVEGLRGGAEETQGGSAWLRASLVEKYERKTCGVCTAAGQPRTPRGEATAWGQEPLLPCDMRAGGSLSRSDGARTGGHRRRSSASSVGAEFPTGDRRPSMPLYRSIPVFERQPLP